MAHFQMYRDSYPRPDLQSEEWVGSPDAKDLSSYRCADSSDTPTQRRRPAACCTQILTRARTQDAVTPSPPHPAVADVVCSKMPRLHPLKNPLLFGKRCSSRFFFPQDVQLRFSIISGQTSLRFRKLQWLFPRVDVAELSSDALH